MGPPYGILIENIKVDHLHHFSNLQNLNKYPITLIIPGGRRILTYNKLRKGHN